MTLVFKKKYEQISYNVTITYKVKHRDQEVSWGKLVWVNNYTVRSLIVVSPRVEGLF
jgi:hypothetical protein